MKADPQFTRQRKQFWSHVRTISQELGYTERGMKAIKIPTVTDIRQKFDRLELDTSHMFDSNGILTSFGQCLLDYFTFRARVLNETVQKLLMEKDEAELHFTRLRKRLNPACPLPMNKQKGEKKSYAFLTCIVNMLVERNLGELPCDYDPRSLTTITEKSRPLRTLSRRVDGAFPSAVNPIAIWEIKEYYYTTTFGSRVADGVYETLLDGMELEELEAAGSRKVQHLLFIDGRFTWWECGRSYLCRIIDLLHIGYVDEVLFGREALFRLPELVKEWKTAHRSLRKVYKNSPGWI